MLKTKLAKFSRIYKKDVELMAAKEFEDCTFNGGWTQLIADNENVEEDFINNIDLHNNNFKQIEFSLRSAITERAVISKFSQIERRLNDKLKTAEKQRNRVLKQLEHRINTWDNYFISRNYK